MGSALQQKIVVFKNPPPNTAHHLGNSPFPLDFQENCKWTSRGPEANVLTKELNIWKLVFEFFLSGIFEQKFMKRCLFAARPPPKVLVAEAWIVVFMPRTVFGRRCKKFNVSKSAQTRFHEVFVGLGWRLGSCFGNCCVQTLTHFPPIAKDPSAPASFCGDTFSLPVVGLWEQCPAQWMECMANPEPCPLSGFRQKFSWVRLGDPTCHFFWWRSYSEQAPTKQPIAETAHQSPKFCVNFFSQNSVRVFCECCQKF